MGIGLDDCVVWDPLQPSGGLTAEELQRRQDDPLEGPLLGARPLLRGRRRRAARKHPGINILVHPECKHEVVLKADLVGSTEFIIKTIEAAEPGPRPGRSAPSSTWSSASPTPTPTRTIVFLDRNVCYCSTMNRIDLPHLVWALENLVAGTVVNRIEVDPDTEADALSGPPADARPARQVAPRLERPVARRRWHDGGSATPSAAIGSPYGTRWRRRTSWPTSPR